MLFQLAFDESEIEHWAKQYSAIYDIEVESIGSNVRKRGYFTKDELQKVAAWKTPRTKPLIASNGATQIELVTRAALSTYDEARRIDFLLSLHGVAYPTASALLHLATDNLYPILDYRALWSLGYDVPPDYTFDFWQEYTHFCLTLAKKKQVSMRTLDRALWQYSKIHQK